MYSVQSSGLGFIIHVAGFTAYLKGYLKIQPRSHLFVLEEVRPYIGTPPSGGDSFSCLPVSGHKEPEATADSHDTAQWHSYWVPWWKWSPSGGEAQILPVNAWK